MLDLTVKTALLRAAARNNADWCEAMCRAHGLAGEFRSDAWTSPTRTPPYYPDAVTLSEHVDAAELLARIDTTVDTTTDPTGEGASVKDSFATLDLAAHGFEPLHDADSGAVGPGAGPQWIAREPDPPAAAPRWQRIRTVGQLAAWEIAWQGGDVVGDSELGIGCLFRPALLEDPSVLVLAAPDLSAGAVLNLGAGVVGVSNLFTADPGVDLARAWHDCLAAASARCPGLPVVGYEAGEELGEAERAGFTLLGPLRIWAATS